MGLTSKPILLATWSRYGDSQIPFAVWCWHAAVRATTYLSMGIEPEEVEHQGDVAGANWLRRMLAQKGGAS